MEVTTPTAAALEALGSNNLELQNSLLSQLVLTAFNKTVQYLQNDLLHKMNADRKKSDVLKDRLVLQQNLLLEVKDPEKDEKTHNFFVSYAGLTDPPFANWIALQSSNNAPAGMTPAQAADIMLKGGTIWVSNAGEKLSAKQVYSYYDQQVEATRSAMSALNAVTSQDNLTLQSLRSKEDSNTQLQSTLIKNEKDRKEGVMRNM